ncbi:MAG TPA: ectonucleotide pyrophosphatase/phosphodiesterase [Flavobacteriaceae bacterium]|nr:ectonucleotide pyrophosphatase/phosphodiesterase [Flavobacteriaceae bacterium]
MLQIRFLLSLLFLGIFLPISAQTEEIKVPNRTNSTAQTEKPYVILISVDGFRDDYFDRFNTPFLNQMRAKGVVAESMIPSFPSVTFPNHYTLVTGLIPAHHGVVGNSMYDPKSENFYSIRNKEAVQNPDWYGGVPIWSLAESQQMLTACYYWPGSEAPIAGYYPTYRYPYSERKSVEGRIARVREWLELPKAERPHLITFYMPEVDHAGHRYGPEALETEFAAKFADAAIQKLVEAVNKTGLPVNYIFVSDHGMTAVDTKQPIIVPKTDSEETKIVSSGTYVSIFTKDKKEKDSLYNTLKKESQVTKQFSVYLKEEVPEKYQFSDKEDKHNRIGDIVMIAQSPYYFSRSGRFVSPGAHGYLPEDTPDMNTVFLAWGPDIQDSKTIKPFKNTHVFPLLAALLELDYDFGIDGDDRLIPLVLKQR